MKLKRSKASAQTKWPSGASNAMPGKAVVEVSAPFATLKR